MSHFNTDPSYAGAMAVPPLQNYSKPQIDLSEWIGHRVLAFKEGVYHLGAIIHVTHDTCDVTVSFDGDPQPILYPDVLSVNALTSLPQCHLSLET